MLVLEESRAQLDSILSGGVYRSFLVHLPKAYTAAKKYPLVLNLHGYNSNAEQQEFYSGMSRVADTLGMIVVYPNGINKEWNIVTLTDVEFLDQLVAFIRAKYSCNSCLFSCGISYGAFMTYKYACASSQLISAIGSVAGNVPITLQNDCHYKNKMPLMHFHGTADAIVSYNGVPPFIPPIERTMQWWVNKNMLNSSPVVTSIEDSDKSDKCTVVLYSYQGINSSAELHFYKIIDGGHTWPGGLHLGILGNTNQDISASSLILSFFKGYCNSSSFTHDASKNLKVQIIPNPSSQYFRIMSNHEIIKVLAFNSVGDEITDLQKIGENYFEIPNSWNSGLYILQITTAKDLHTISVNVLR